MRKKAVADILKLLPEEQLAKLGSSTGVDQGVSRLYGDIMLKLLVFSHLKSDRLSTHMMELFYNSPLFSLFSGKGGHKTRHSSLASRLSTMNADYFAELFQWCSQRFAKEMPKSKFSRQVVRFDSTLCAISSALVNWGMQVGRPAKEGPAKVQLKFSVGLTNSLPSSVESFFDQGHLSEENALKEAIQKANLQKEDLLVFDLGLKSRKTLQSFDEQGLHFVTKGSSKLRYEYIDTHSHIKGRSADGLRFLQDSKVYLYANGQQKIAHAFRLVEVLVEKTGKPLRFITNIWQMSAMDIARIYRMRWDIEVFFRFIKQELNVKHLLNHTENGIRIQIYTALITAILVLVYKASQKVPGYKLAKILFADELMLLLVERLSAKAPAKRKGLMAASSLPAP